MRTARLALVAALAVGCKRRGRSLLLTGVDAYVETPKARNLYRGPLPFQLAASMTRDEVARLLGKPAQSGEDIPYDSWHKEGLTVTIGFTQGVLRISHVEVALAPPA